MPRTWNIISRVLRVTAWTGIVVLAAVLATVTLLPKVSDLQTVAITGRSMTGSIPLGSLAVAAPVATDEVRVGDVITYDHPVTGVRVTHRVTAVATRDGAQVFRTKGDHNAYVDPWRVQYVDDTAWRVQTHVPLLGRVVLELQSPRARMLLVAAPAAVLLLLTLGSIWKTPTPATPAAEAAASSRIRPARKVTRTGVRS